MSLGEGGSRKASRGLRFSVLSRIPARWTNPGGSERRVQDPIKVPVISVCRMPPGFPWVREERPVRFCVHAVPTPPGRSVCAPRATSKFLAMPTRPGRAPGQPDDFPPFRSRPRFPRRLPQCVAWTASADSDHVPATRRHVPGWRYSMTACSCRPSPCSTSWQRPRFVAPGDPGLQRIGWRRRHDQLQYPRRRGAHDRPSQRPANRPLPRRGRGLAGFGREERLAPGPELDFCPFCSTQYPYFSRVFANGSATFCKPWGVIGVSRTQEHPIFPGFPGYSGLQKGQKSSWRIA